MSHDANVNMSRLLFRLMKQVVQLPQIYRAKQDPSLSSDGQVAKNFVDNSPTHSRFWVILCNVSVYLTLVGKAIIINWIFSLIIAAEAHRNGKYVEVGIFEAGAILAEMGYQVEG